MNFFEICYTSKFWISKTLSRLLGNLNFYKTKDKNTKFVVLYK